mgnify:CR=1 FL=1
MPIGEKREGFVAEGRKRAEAAAKASEQEQPVAGFDDLAVQDERCDRTKNNATQRIGDQRGIRKSEGVLAHQVADGVTDDAPGAAAQENQEVIHVFVNFFTKIERLAGLFFCCA